MATSETQNRQNEQIIQWCLPASGNGYMHICHTLQLRQAVKYNIIKL